MKILFIMILFLTGCDSSPLPLSNEEIVRQVEFCRQHQMTPHLIGNAFTRKVFRVQCQVD